MPNQASNAAFFAANSGAEPKHDPSIIRDHPLTKLIIEATGYRGPLSPKFLVLVNGPLRVIGKDGQRHSYPSLLELWDTNTHFQFFCQQRTAQLKAFQNGQFVLTAPILASHLAQLWRPAQKPDGKSQMPGYFVWAEANPPVEVSPEDQVEEVEGVDFIINMRDSDDNE